MVFPVSSVKNGVYIPGRRAASRPAPSRLPVAVYRNPAPAPKAAGQRKPSPDILSSTIHDITASFHQVLRNPVVVILAAISAVFIASYIFTPKGEEPLFTQFLVPYNTTQLYAMYEKYPSKFYGVMAFLPVYMAMRPSLKDHTLIAVAIAAWIFLVPEAGVIEYVIQALALHVFFFTRRSSTKAVVIAAVVGLYFFGYAVQPGNAELITNCSCPVDFNTMICYDENLNLSTSSRSRYCHTLPEYQPAKAEYWCNFVLNSAQYALDKNCTDVVLPYAPTIRENISHTITACASPAFSASDLCKRWLNW
jgi:hypothetical protein